MFFHLYFFAYPPHKGVSNQFCSFNHDDAFFSPSLSWVGMFFVFLTLGGRGHSSGSPRLPNFVPFPIFGQIGGAGIPNMPKKNMY